MRSLYLFLLLLLLPLAAHAGSIEKAASKQGLTLVKEDREERKLQLRYDNYATQEDAKQILLDFLQSKMLQFPLKQWLVEINFYGRDGSFPPPKTVSFIRLRKGEISYGMVQPYGGIAITKKETLPLVSPLADLNP